MPADPGPSRRGARPGPGTWRTVAGAAILGTGLWALIRDLEGWNVFWYVPAWYGYLLLVDAAIHRLGGRSFLDRRRELGAMMLWSVPFWYLFEAYNLVLENWYYVFILRSDALQAGISVLAFATVFPACFFHAELIRALDGFRALRFRPVVVGRGLRRLWLALGIASIVLPLLQPRWAFPLVWGATLWLPDLINDRVGAPSFLRDLAEGRGERLARLLAGGLWAGGIWELFNYWARCKWIYTVPGFEAWKLFEMPFLGFFGFPVLALGAFACYSLLSHFLRGGRNWEAPGPAAATPRRRYALAVIVSVVFCWAMFRAVLAHTVESRRPLLGELDGLDPQAVARLRAGGVPTPERLYAAVEAEGAAAFAERLDLDPVGLDEARRHAGLALHKGMGTGMASLLREAGVGEVADLAAVDADDLHRRLLAEAARIDLPPPRPAEVEVWVRAARLGAGTRR